jgi:hypothetical protein
VSPARESCLCGCGEAVGAAALYRPGHDARHAAAVGRQLRLAGRPDEALLAALPSEALRAKAAAMLTGLRGFVAGTKHTASPPEPAVAAAPADPRSTAELLSGYAQTLAELRRRGVVRSNNAPAGDYGEWLTARALGGTLVENFSVKSYDLTLPAGERVQVKTRVVSAPVRRGQLQASVFRSWDFELAALVLLRDNDYAVHRAALVPVQVVQSSAVRVEHVNGWRLVMTDDVLAHPEAQDFTDAAREAAAAA